MAIHRPLGELDLANKFRPEPHAIFHLLARQRPLRAFALREIDERTEVRLETFEAARDLPSSGKVRFDCAVRQRYEYRPTMSTTMQQYAGYWISGDAVPGPPYTHYWQSEATIYKPRPSGSIIRVRSGGRSVVALRFTGVRRWFDLQLCLLMVDTLFPPNISNYELTVREERSASSR